MSSPTTRIRLAITSFAEQALLRRTLTGLLAEGFAASQMCLIGTARQLATMCLGAGAGFALTEHAELAPLCARIRQVDPNVDNVLATAGPVLDVIVSDLRRNGGPSRKGLTLGDLDCSNGVVLVVLSTEPTQQLAATRQMLAGSHACVATHEYPPTDAAVAEIAVRAMSGQRNATACSA